MTRTIVSVSGRAGSGEWFVVFKDPHHDWLCRCWVTKRDYPDELAAAAKVMRVAWAPEYALSYSYAEGNGWFRTGYIPKEYQINA